MVILFTGDRNWTNRQLINQICSKIPSGSIIVHGDARGLDSIVDEIARGFDLTIHKYPAHWTHNENCVPGCTEMCGKPAGVIRNQRMLNSEHPDLVLAFHNDITKSKGTKDMLKRTIKNGIAYRLFNEQGQQYFLKAN